MFQTTKVINNKPVEWHLKAPNRAKYQRSIEYVKANQRNGNCYLANLTCKIPVQTNLTMRDIFLRSTAKYRCWIKDKFVCFSPEIFVRIEGETIHSFPMKGTIAASVPNAANVLMNNAKEACRTCNYCRLDTKRFKHCCQQSKRREVSIHRQANHE